jgi:hypothetical protein
VKSEKISRKDHFPFNLYENPLKSNRLRNFLEDPKYAGKNQYQTADEIENNLEKATRLVFHALLNHQKLETSKVYEVINAKSMHHILDAAIKNYDFRSSELIRLFFEISIIFLKNSPNFKSQKEIIEDMANPLSKFFQMLSESLLQNEKLNENITKEEKEDIQKFMKKSLIENSHKEYQMIKKQNVELYNQLHELDIHERIISKHIDITSPFDPMIPYHEDVPEIIKNIRKNKERMVELSGESSIREGQIWRLSNAYNHLEPYACRIRPLKEFDYLLRRTMSSRSYVSHLDSEFNQVKLDEEFQDMMCEKYHEKTLNKKIPAILLSHSQKKLAAEVPEKEYGIEKREFFRKHGIDLDNRLRPKKEHGGNFDVYKYKPKWAFDEKYSLIP